MVKEVSISNRNAPAQHKPQRALIIKQNRHVLTLIVRIVVIPCICIRIYLIFSCITCFWVVVLYGFVYANLNQNARAYLNVTYISNTRRKHADNPQTPHQQHANSLHAYLGIANVHFDITCAYLHNFIFIFFFISISFVYNIHMLETESEAAPAHSYTHTHRTLPHVCTYVL